MAMGLRFRMNYPYYRFEIPSFSRVVFPITVGRDKSIKAVNDAYKADKLIGVVAQKDSNVEDPGITDLEDIGTVAKIVKLIKMPDGGTTVIIQGKNRFKIECIHF